MTSEEIKQAYSMTDILSMYGLAPDRKGQLLCPFHKDKHPSMKIYEKDYHCFTCGANGDIFTFVQKMDNLTFKEAFTILGGTYKRESFESKLKAYKAIKRRETEQRKEQRLQEKRELNNMLIDIYRDWVNKSEPLSQVWTDSYNALQLELYHHEQLNEVRR